MAAKTVMCSPVVSGACDKQGRSGWVEVGKGRERAEVELKQKQERPQKRKEGRFGESRLKKRTLNKTRVRRGVPPDNLHYV